MTEAPAVHLPTLRRAHLADALAFMAERRAGSEEVPALHLAAFDAVFLLGTGTWWGRREQRALEVPTEDGPRFVDQEGQAQAALPDGREGDAWARVGPPDVDPRLLARRVEVWRAGSGIGLYFRREADALDEEEVVETLWNYSCHPFLGRRIVDDLRTQGERFATVMPALARQIPNLREHLAPLGVSVALTAPMPTRGVRDVPVEHQDVPVPRRFRP